MEQILRRRPEPLSAAAFAPFGAVVETPRSGGQAANDGTARRFDDIAPLVLGANGGRPQASLFRVSPARLPLRVARLERHPLSTQLFLPIAAVPFLVVVAQGRDAPDPATLRAFITSGRQGVDYAPGVWHHPVIAIGQETEFFALGRAQTAPGDDCDETGFPGGVLVEIEIGEGGGDFA